jgi:hypothetical protein
VIRTPRAILALIAALIAPAGASAQQAAVQGAISGSVIDARSSAPLPYATVTLSAGDGLGLLSDPKTSAGMAVARTTTTSTSGEYRFSGLPIGAYRLRIQRVGYEAATIDVRLGDSGTSPVSVGLVVLPVRLRPVEVRARESNASLERQLSHVVVDDNRVAAARSRQSAFLSTDARELTLDDVAESATLGGSDVLRSLERLPGVAPLDDWSAKFWIRGNRWDHNRVYFDDVPLFDPLGVLGRTSGVSATSIAGAFLHPGVRPVSLGGEGATRVDLRTRAAAVASDWRGSAEVSQFGVGTSLERGRSDSSAGILVTAQKTLGQWLPRTGFFSQALDGRSFRDAEATARTDLDLGGRRRLELSGLFADDARLATSTLDSNRTSQDWRNAVGRATFFAPLGPLASSHTIAVSSFAARSDRWISLVSPSAPALAPVVTAAPVTSSVDYLTLSGRFATQPTTRQTLFGYDLTSQRSTLDGTQDYLLGGDAAHAFDSRSTKLSFGSAWAEHREKLSDEVTIDGGMRVDLGGVRGVDAVRPSGNVQMLITPGVNTRLSVGASRVHQYIQALPVALIGQGETLPTSWLTSGGDVPVMSVDNFSTGVEQWISSSMLVTANAYARRTGGAISDDPTPGPLVRRPFFVDATETAQGVEVSARKLAGRLTGILSYSYNDATTRARGFSFASPSSRTNVLGASLALHIASFNLASGYTMASGAPYTRMVVNPTLDTAGHPRFIGPTVRGEPDAQRMPAYSSLDLSLDYVRSFGRTRLIAFAGAQNVLRRANATWYEATGYCTDAQSRLVTGPQCRDNDVFARPVRLVPTLGVRLVVR